MGAAATLEAKGLMKEVVGLDKRPSVSLQSWSTGSLDSVLLYIASSVEIDIHSIHQFINPFNLVKVRVRVRVTVTLKSGDPVVFQGFIGAVGSSC